MHGWTGSPAEDRSARLAAARQGGHGRLRHGGLRTSDGLNQDTGQLCCKIASHPAVCQRYASYSPRCALRGLHTVRQRLRRWRSPEHLPDIVALGYLRHGAKSVATTAALHCRDHLGGARHFRSHETGRKMMTTVARVLSVTPC